MHALWHEAVGAAPPPPPSPAPNPETQHTVPLAQFWALVHPMETDPIGQPPGSAQEVVGPASPPPPPMAPPKPKQHTCGALQVDVPQATVPTPPPPLLPELPLLAVPPLPELALLPLLEPLLLALPPASLFPALLVDPPHAFATATPTETKKKVDRPLMNPSSQKF
jgi:hypothetical protein